MEKTKIEIEIPVNLNTQVVTAKITLAQGKEPILAFVQLDFGFITVKGITVKKVDFKHDGNETLIFDLPAYRAGITFVKSVFIPDKRLFSELARTVVQKVEEELAIVGNSLRNDQHVDPDDIPF